MQRLPSIPYIFSLTVPRIKTSRFDKCFINEIISLDISIDSYSNFDPFNGALDT